MLIFITKPRRLYSKTPQRIEGRRITTKASPCQCPGRPRGRAACSDRLSVSSAAITSEAVQDIPSASKADDPRQSQPLPTLRPSLWPCALLRSSQHIESSHNQPRQSPASPAHRRRTITDKASPCQRPGRPRGRAPCSDRLSISSAAITSEPPRTSPAHRRPPITDKASPCQHPGRPCGRATCSGCLR